VTVLVLRGLFKVQNWHAEHLAVLQLL
jgi:hypothetical protein